MILLVDAGNTSTKIGCCDNTGTRSLLKFDTASESRIIEEHFNKIKEKVTAQELREPEGASMCSVVPGISSLVADVLKKTFKVKLLIADSINSGLRFSIKHPEGLGADRIANAAAAHALYKGNVLVVDFGTATTICLVTEEGEYRGGAIMPGPALSAACLAEMTAKLPMVELKKPEKILGEDTKENILAGIIWGHTGAVEKIASEVGKGITGSLTVVATGGYADLVAQHTEIINYVNPLLTLEGLRIIYEYNTGRH